MLNALRLTIIGSTGHYELETVPETFDVGTVDSTSLVAPNNSGSISDMPLTQRRYCFLWFERYHIR